MPIVGGVAGPEARPAAMLAADSPATDETVMATPSWAKLRV
jgi:hypothetical protein